MRLRLAALCYTLILLDGVLVAEMLRRELRLRPREKMRWKVRLDDI
jgi:hypothetical protein